MKRRKSKSEVVPWIPTLGSYSIGLPGHEGARPGLAFVLKVLAGDECGMTRMHFDVVPFQTPEDTAQREAILANGREIPLAEDSMVAMMRYLADLWIDSGRSGEGKSRVDNPAKRNVRYEPPQSTPPVVIKIPTEFEPPFEGWDVFTLPVGAPISHLFYDLIGNEARWPEIREDGTQTLKEVIFGLRFDHNGIRNRREQMVRFGRKIAMYWFAKLLDSPYAHHLARCDECRAYFEYDRAPRSNRKSVLCSSCKGRGSANRVNSIREAVKDRMLNAAAFALASWRPSHRTPDMHEWVRTRVNKACRTSVQRKWVSQNMRQIQDRVEALRNAKG